MDGVADVLGGDAVPEDDSVLEVGRVSRLLGVHADQVHVLPKLVQKVVQVQLHLATDKQTSKQTSKTSILLLPDDD